MRIDLLASLGLSLLLGTSFALAGAGLPAAGGEEVAPIWGGVYTEGQARRGEDVYLEACAVCHLEDLSGDEMAVGLKGVAFSFRWRDETLRALFESLEGTMPQEDPGSLGDQAYADLIAYMLEVNGFPPGETELPAELEELEKLQVTRQP